MRLGITEDEFMTDPQTAKRKGRKVIVSKHPDYSPLNTTSIFCYYHEAYEYLFPKGRPRPMQEHPIIYRPTPKRPRKIIPLDELGSVRDPEKYELILEISVIYAEKPTLLYIAYTPYTRTYNKSLVLPKDTKTLQVQDKLYEVQGKHRLVANLDSIRLILDLEFED